jgi:hypothetical protein
MQKCKATQNRINLGFGLVLETQKRMSVTVSMNVNYTEHICFNNGMILGKKPSGKQSINNTISHQCDLHITR